MKKILLATTMLVGTAGVAAAEISFSGSAKAGIATDHGLHARAYSSVGLDVAFTGATDNGVEFGADFGLSAGQSYDFADDGGFAQESGAFGMPNVWVSGSFGKIEFSANEFDHFDDANGSADVKYTGTFGAFGVGVITDIGSGNTSASADATFGGIALHADADTYGEYNGSAAYTMGAFTGTVGYGMDSDDGDPTTDENHWDVGVAYASGSITASADYNSSEEIDLAAGYAANGISVGFEYGTDADAATDDTYTITGGYDLGGGLSLEAGYNYTGDAFIGAAMAF